MYVALNDLEEIKWCNTLGMDPSAKICQVLLPKQKLSKDSF